MPIPALGYMSSALRTNAEMKQALEDMTAAQRAALGGAAASTLTIAAGSVTPTGGIHAVDTEAAAATDDLSNIAQTGIEDGGLLLLVLANAARNVVIKHMAGGTGQVFLSRAVDLELDVLDQAILLRRNGTRWDQVVYNPGTMSKRPQAKGGAYTVVGTDYDSIIRCTTALTLSLTALATLGSGFFFDVYADGGNVTVDPAAAEQINGAATLVIASGTSARIYHDGSAWRAMVRIDPNAMTAETSVASGDFLPIYDISEGANNKATAENVVAGLAASQAEQEAASALNRIVVPARQQLHPSAAKGWVYVTGAGSPSAAASYNVSSITDNGVGDFTINWGTDFSSANYACAAMIGDDGAAPDSLDARFHATTPLAAGTTRVMTVSNNSNTDIDRWSVIAFGDH